MKSLNTPIEITRTFTKTMRKKLKYPHLYIHTLKRRIRDYLRFDSWLFSFLFSSQYVLRIFVHKYFVGNGKHLELAGALFRRTRIAAFRSLSTYVLNGAIGHSTATATGTFCRSLEPPQNEQTLFSKRLLVLSPPLGDKKGVLILAFNGFFRFFADRYDLDRLAERYVVVAEPSYAGLFHSDICSLLSNNLQVLMQTLEPVDARFIRSVRAPFHSVELASNMWIDPGIFQPLDGCEKRYDLVMVALWADYKRHYHLFSAMAKAKNKVKVALIGGAWPYQVDRIYQLADMYGVRDQITCFEKLPQTQVNRILNESKFHILTSKKEGSPRALIESLFAGTPIAILDGFNFGHHYHFINPRTGVFLDPQRVDRFIDSLASLDLARFEAAQWARQNILPSIATDKVKAGLAELEQRFGIAINKDLAIKVNKPEMAYQSEQDRIRLEPLVKELDRFLRHP